MVNRTKVTDSLFTKRFVGIFLSTPFHLMMDCNGCYEPLDPIHSSEGVRDLLIEQSDIWNLTSRGTMEQSIG